jgi:hypothetical protein
MLLQGGYLINFKQSVKVVYIGKPKSGGNGDIQKRFIKGDPTISKHWKFAAKTQKGDTKAMKKMRFIAKAMALRSTHKGHIKWIVAHIQT